MPGVAGTDYAFCTDAQYAYLASKGFNCVRTCVKWERITLTPGGALNEPYMTLLDAAIESANSRGMWTILNLHNYHRYKIGSTEHIIGSATVTRAHYADVWGKIAARYKNKGRLMFGLMNEPHDVPGGASTVFADHAAALDAIRNAGATQTCILSGTSWDGAHTWVTSGNATAALTITDPNVIFEVHQYLDADGAGDSANCVVGTGTLAGDGVYRMRPAVEWAVANNKVIILTETSWTPANTTCQAWAPAMISYLQANYPHVCGLTYWALYTDAFGPWDSNVQLLNPINNNDRQQIPLLQAALTPGASSGGGGGGGGGTPEPLNPVFAAGGRTTNKAWMADDFCRRVGVCTHMGAGDYETKYEALKPFLTGMGLRVIRFNISEVAGTTTRLREIGNAGIKFTLTGTPGGNGETLKNAVKNLGVEYVLAVEGLNEPGPSKNWSGGYIAETTRYQQSLYNAFKGDSATRDSIYVTSPSIAGENVVTGSPGSASEWPGLYQYFDVYNTHGYPGAGIIENTTLTSRLANTFDFGGPTTGPLFLTETGWSNSNTTYEWQQTAAPRLMLWWFSRGLSLVLKYEFVDEGPSYNNGGDRESNFGYLRNGGNWPTEREGAGWVAKPAYTAMQNLYSILNDPGPRHNTETLNYTITGNSFPVGKVLFQKRNGDFYLALWVQTSANNTDTIAVNLPAGVIGAAATARPSNSTAWTTVPITNNTVSVGIYHGVTILRLQK